MTRASYVVAAAATVVGLLAGCSSGGDGAASSRTPAPTSAPTSGSPSSTESPSDPARADRSAYLPTPEGVVLTTPGSVLDFKEAALAAWKPRQDVVGVVTVRVMKVQRTTVEKSLAGFQLSPEEEASTPYFVSTAVGNGGETDLGGRQLPIYVVDSNERLIAPTGVDQDFAACPGSVLPAIFAPDDTARSCLIFLVPPDATLRSVMFRPPEGVVPLTWVGKVKELGAKGGGTTKRDKAARPQS